MKHKRLTRSLERLLLFSIIILWGWGEFKFLGHVVKHLLDSLAS